MFLCARLKKLSTLESNHPENRTSITKSTNILKFLVSSPYNIEH
jgi:hypothetical protein